MLKQAKDVDLFSMSSKARNRKRRTMRIVANTVLTFILVVSLGITAAMGYYIGVADNRIGFVDQENEESHGLYEELYTSAGTDVSYVLVVGEGWAEKGVSEGLTDVIMVACLDHTQHTLNLLQIPRDLFIGTDVPTNKINAVYAYPRKGEAKINALRRRLGTHLGIPLDHYVIFTLTGFRNAVDAVGGVDINITAKNGLKLEDQDHVGKYYTIGPGLVHLDGNMATGFVRKRYGTKSEGYGLGDLSRVAMQRVFYAALFKKLSNVSTTQLAGLVKACYNDFSTDISLNDVLGYAVEVKKIPFSNIGIYSVPGMYVDYQPSGYSAKLAFFSISKSEYVKLFNAHMNPYGQELKKDDLRVRELHTELGVKWEGRWGDEGGTLEEIIDKKGQS